MGNTERCDQAFFQWLNAAKAKQCRQCKFWVQKNEGCDHMTCRCGHEFCYICGADYQTCGHLPNMEEGNGLFGDDDDY